MTQPKQRPHAVLEPSRGWVELGLAEVWRYRELLYFLTWRDLKVRYKQTALGALWAVLQPFVTMVVFTVFFGRLLGVDTGDLPKPIFYYSGTLIWTYFATALAASSNSLVGAQNLIKKVYFPRLIIPLSATLSGLVDLAIALTVMIGLMAYYSVWPAWQNVIFLPALALLALATASAVGLWLSALNVKFRDVRYAIPFLIQIWMFATPIIYPLEKIPEQWRMWYGLNPMVGVVEGFRWALLGRGEPPGGVFWLSIGVTAVLLVAGAFYFRRMEEEFADIV